MGWHNIPGTKFTHSGDALAFAYRVRYLSDATRRVVGSALDPSRTRAGKVGGSPSNATGDVVRVTIGAALGIAGAGVALQKRDACGVCGPA